MLLALGEYTAVKDVVIVTAVHNLYLIRIVLLQFCRWEISGKPTVNFSKVQELKNSEIKRLSELYMGNLEKVGVKFFEGRGKVTGPNSVQVNGKEFKVSKFSRPECLQLQAEVCRSNGIVPSRR